MRCKSLAIISEFEHFTIARPIHLQMLDPSLVQITFTYLNFAHVLNVRSFKHINDEDWGASRLVWVES